MMWMVIINQSKFMSSFNILFIQLIYMVLDPGVVVVILNFHCYTLGVQ